MGVSGAATSDRDLQVEPVTPHVQSINAPHNISLEYAFPLFGSSLRWFLCPCCRMPVATYSDVEKYMLSSLWWSDCVPDNMGNMWSDSSSLVAYTRRQTSSCSSKTSR